MKLWQKENVVTADEIEKFTVGRDREFDGILARYDVMGSLAHAQMLQQIGILSEEEFQSIKSELEHIAADIAAGHFQVDENVEDIHSQIEFLLTSRLGAAGKKIHTGRSRNDQVAVDIKLYLKEAAQEIKAGTHELFNVLISLSDQHKDTLMPGYTHLQIAMPSSFGLWLGAYAECLVEDLEMLAAAYAIVNKNPLGSGAGYGSTFPIDRETTTELLGFRTMHYNAICAQMSRGRTEKAVAMAISCIAATLGRLAMDICLFMSQNFGFVSFPDTLTTGSSIMPHKKNPDVFELIRGKCNRLQSVPNELSLLLTNLPSGYHRDLQMTKEVLFPAIETLKSCMDMFLLTLPQIQVTADILADKKYAPVFSVVAINELVEKGIPFREAYQTIAGEITSGSFIPPAVDLGNYTHAGSIGNLCNEEIRRECALVLDKML